MDDKREAIDDFLTRDDRYGEAQMEIVVERLGKQSDSIEICAFYLL
jgi:hypothetical protein